MVEHLLLPDISAEAQATVVVCTHLQTE